jgi:hypothetical protein
MSYEDGLALYESQIRARDELLMQQLREEALQRQQKQEANRDTQ